MANGDVDVETAALTSVKPMLCLAIDVDAKVWGMGFDI